jgi:hypothetical protein
MPMTNEELRLAVEPLNWVFAKTMPENPHFYIVRGPHNENVYAALFTAIRERGDDAPYGRTTYRYLRLGDGWKYWVMTHDIRQSRILNRARDE